MAEVSKVVSRSVVHLKATDGSGTPLTYTFKLLGVPTFAANVPQESEAVMGQQGGVSVIEAISFNGVSGPMEMNFTTLLNDPGNTSDATAQMWLTQLETNTLAGGLSTLTSTNGLPYVGKTCVIWTITFENVGTANADHTWVADGYVESTSISVVNGAMAISAKVMLVEGWTRANS